MEWVFRGRIRGRVGMDGRERKAYHVRADLLAGDLVVDDHFCFVGLVTGRGWFRGYGFRWRFNAVCLGRRAGRGRSFSEVTLRRRRNFATQRVRRCG